MNSFKLNKSLLTESEVCTGKYNNNINEFLKTRSLSKVLMSSGREFQRSGAAKENDV
jgi:hypothetical protein